MARKNDGKNTKDNTTQDTPTTLEVKGVEGVEAMANKTEKATSAQPEIGGHVYTVEYIKTVPPEMGGGDQFFVFKDGTRIAQVVFVNEVPEVLSGVMDSDALSGAAIAIDNVLAARQGIQPSYVGDSQTK